MEPWKKHRVLVVDDEAQIRADLERTLSYAGFTVVTAASGEEALETLETCPAEVIIADQKMPGMSGTEFLTKVRGAYPDTIRVVLSAYAEQDMLIGALNDANVLQYILKPWNEDHLIAQVSLALELYHERFERKRLAEANRHLIERQALLENYSWFGSMSYSLYDKFFPLISHQHKLLIANRGEHSTETVELGELVSTISRLGKFASLYAHDRQSEPTHDSLNDIVHGSVADATHALRNASAVDFTVELAEDVPPLLLHPTLMRVAVNALIENAILHNESPRRAVVVRTELQDGHVVLSVHDNGPGIDTSMRTQVFAPLYSTFQRRVEHLAKPELAGDIDMYNFGHEGHGGLGLPFARYCATQHGGTLELVETHDGGACFELRLPIH